jgi:hypothetical protein
VAVDGVLGQQTRAALVRFQAAYGLSADGVAGSATFAKLDALQDAGCTGDHVHLDSRGENHSDGLPDTWCWSAPSCGIPTMSAAQAGLDV